MHAILVEVKVDAARGDEARKLLEEMVVPTMKALPGFVGGYWLGSEDGASGASIVVFESEETAQNAADNRPGPPEGAPVTVTRFEVRPVFANA